MPLPGEVTDLSRLETSEVTFDSDGFPITGYLVKPREALNGAAIMILPDALGLTEHFRDVTRRYANLGYVALGVEMMSRYPIQNPEDRGEVFSKQLQMDDVVVVTDVEAAAAFLRSLPEVTGKIGAIGYCAGGRQVLLTACKSTAIDAGIDCWGGQVAHAAPNTPTTPLRPVRVLDMIEDMNGVIFGVFGEGDHDPTVAHAEELREKMERYNKPGRVKVYTGAGHAFFADYRPQLYCEGPAFELWEDTKQFFEETLLS